MVTSNVQDVLGDASLDIVVEVIGGTDSPARDLVLGSAASGKSVVTANKALLAASLPELKRAFTSRRRALGYEASVAGGIPIIRAMQHSLLPDTVRSVQGILNGTSNYILGSMAEGQPFAAALAAAQAAGFAEADPTADVAGHDACNKLVILTQLAYGCHVPPSQVRTQGITGITPFDVQAAKASGYAIKHLGVSTLFEKAEQQQQQQPTLKRPRQLLDMFVSPALVPLGGSFASTGGAGNLVVVDSEALGRSSYGGAGAGREATANSILADLVAIAKGSISARPFPRPAPARLGLTIKPSNTLRRLMYVRGPQEVTNLLSMALWRQGRELAPCSGQEEDSATGLRLKAFMVDASAGELTSLVARAARKVAAPAASNVTEQQVTELMAVYPVLK